MSWNPILRGIVLVALLGVAAYSPALAVGCGSSVGCMGWCPHPDQWCVDGGELSGCYCDSGIPDGCLGKLEVSTTFSASLSDSPAGPNWFTPGNMVTITQSTDASVEVHHSAEWGGGIQSIPVPKNTLTAAVRFTEYDSTDPDRLWFEVVSLGAVLPSFASVALGGDQTGDNTFALDPGENKGWIDLATGDFYVKVYAHFNNDVFAAEPATAQVSISGSYDFATNRLTLAASSGQDVDVVASSPE